MASIHDRSSCKQSPPPIVGSFGGPSSVVTSWGADKANLTGAITPGVDKRACAGRVPSTICQRNTGQTLAHCKQKGGVPNTKASAYMSYSSWHALVCGSNCTETGSSHLHCRQLLLQKHMDRIVRLGTGLAVSASSGGASDRGGLLNHQADNIGSMRVLDADTCPCLCCQGPQCTQQANVA